MSKIPEEIEAIFEYIKENIDTDNWRVQRENYLNCKPDGQVKGWSLISGNGRKAWDIKVTLFESSRTRVEFFYFKTSRTHADNWEKFDSADLLDDINFERVDQALALLDTLKGGIANLGNFDEFGDYTGKWG